MVTRVIYNVGQSILSFIDQGKIFRLDSSLAQKTLQIAYSSLDAFILPQFPDQKLKKFSFSLKATADMFDTYRIVQDIYSFFFPVSAASINENEVLTSVINSNANYLKNHEEVKNNNNQNTAKKNIITLLLEMGAKNVSYRNINDFNIVLLKRLEFFGIKCQLTNECLHQTPILERIINIVWTTVNAGCVIDRLREWKLLDTTKLAGQLGQIPLLSWVKKQSLGHWIVGLVLTGFTLQAVNGGLKLASQEPLTQQDKQNTSWSTYSSLAESILFGAIFSNMMGKTRISVQSIDYCRIAAKFIGSTRILSQRPREYFQEPVVDAPVKTK